MEARLRQGRARIPKAPPLSRPNGLADLTLETAIRRATVLALEYCEGDVTWAAEELGVDRTTLWRWLKRWRGVRPRSQAMGAGRLSRPRTARLELVAGGKHA